MDKSTRILNILTLLINGNIVNKNNIQTLTEVSDKSIQRDITTINNFFYESEYWRSQKSKIIYNRVLNGYQLVNNINHENSLGILSLLIKIKSLTPILHYDIYKLFLDNIASAKLEDQNILKEMLNSFKVRTDLLPGTSLMTIQKAISNQHYIRMTTKNEKLFVKPLSILYMHFDYWFSYEYEKKVYNIAMRNIIAVDTLSSKFNQTNIQEPFKFEIDTSIWHQFQKQYSIKKLVAHNDTSVTVLVNCTKFDAYYIAYQLAPLAKMLGPQSYIDDFVQRLEEIHKTYTE
ncbi:hypothetical protein J3T65_09435 [Staphylococcus simiae]|uniref:hypothetical protein n=1 Tax=Staphylococcus simiae TaxID=308354 RepID=UPI001A969885|nr:hypothetical protein [Staphylococcus simiae]MBO1199414.1 hypothetical protein [Staphylococcus simiae]MBO1201893.1 hypothetical protein [Staphylococcus simiae]MBO1204107.1 hypothetical protein [Staphylococcus simiae]MBO1211126.1 hypothetical protein [Staphylococcus simiae]MBO1230342.1 hypothetical protein [Staphylococcus simiae]